ncbi:hypothetical protein ACSSS7_007780 [Eimeria intestinalis]
MDKPEATVWAAVCSNGEVVVFLRTEEADDDAAERLSCISIFSRISLTAWFAGQNHKGPTALSEAREWADNLISSPTTLQLPIGCGCWLDAAHEEGGDHEDSRFKTLSKSMGGIFVLGMATTTSWGPLGAVAFLPSHPDLREACSDPKRVHLWNWEEGSSEGAVGASGGIAPHNFHLLALGAEGVLHGAQLQSFPDKPYAATSADSAQLCSGATATWKVLASSTDPPTMSTSTNLSSNIPLLTTAQAKRDAVIAAICWETGVMQLWLMPSPSAASSTAIGVNSAKPAGEPTPIIIRMSCILPTKDESLLAMQTQNKAMGNPVVGITRRQLGKNETRLRGLHRMSLKTAAHKRLESLLSEKKIQWAEETWLKEVLPTNESMVQMQQVDLATVLNEFEKNAEAYLIQHGQVPQEGAEAFRARNIPAGGLLVEGASAADSRIIQPEAGGLQQEACSRNREDATTGSKSKRVRVAADGPPPIINRRCSPRLLRFRCNQGACLRVLPEMYQQWQSCISETSVVITVSSSAARATADGLLKDSTIAGVLRSVNSKGVLEQSTGNDASDGEPEPRDEAAHKALEKMMGAWLNSKRTSGKQDYRTPHQFSHQEERRFWLISLELAQRRHALFSKHNSKLEVYDTLLCRFSMVRSLFLYQREPWMDTVDPVAMTEAQATRFAAYQEQQRAIKEKEEAVRTKVESELKRLREDFDSTAAHLRNDLRSLQALGRLQVHRACAPSLGGCLSRRVHEKERLVVELAINRIIRKIALEKEAGATEALSKSRHATCKELLQELQQGLQKQQGVCWLLEDEKAAAQQNQKEKAAALSAASSSGHVSSEALAAFNKRLHEA